MKKLNKRLWSFVAAKTKMQNYKEIPYKLVSNLESADDFIKEVDLIVNSIERHIWKIWSNQ